MIALIVSVIALLVLAILLFPVNFSFNSVRSEGTINGSLGVSWIIFLFSYALKKKQLEIHIFGRSIYCHISPEKKSPEKKPQAQEPEKEIKKSGKIPPIRDFLNMAGPMMRLFKDLIYAFRIKYLDVEVSFGLNDPAYTGITTGFMHALGLSRLGHNIRWTPDFTGQALDWDVKGKTALIPVRLIPPVARFITNPQVLRSGWRIIRG
ncbi:MAG: hypothetical protein Q8M95_07735 [Candidatus Methanoperedens sp.]|nr:hypothetical protein [Candidatus Methanoperedens sp.]